MLKRFKNKKAQANVGEYVLVFFLIIGMVTAMTVYVKRSLQARLYDARNLIKNMDKISDGTKIKTTPMLGNIVIAYEPYYTVTEMNRVSTVEEKKDLSSYGSAKVGFFNKDINEQTSVQSISETVSSVFANK